ncbi:formate transporter FocB [Escherichia coli]|uniref:Formate transporter FocB n=1 Tax=Escherichia coli TaxID=562 RepID=A0A376VEB7_ECOLX|nr:formate transporter FocB [Escherichia coli]
MRNKLSFDLQLSARKAAIAERIAAHKIARSKVSVFFNGDVRWRVYGDWIYFLPFRYRRCPVFTGINPSGGRPCFTLGFILLAVCGTSLFTSVGNDGDGKKSGRY